MATHPPFELDVIEGLARVLGDTSSGLTGSQIADLLGACRVPDPGEMTKWRRLTEALTREQARTRSGNCVIIVVKTAMRPVRWTGFPDHFEEMRGRLNEVLAFVGLEVRKNGQMARRSPARTHDEAMQLTRRLRKELERRHAHAEVFRYCTRELLAEDCFGAVFEATKGLAERVRGMADVDADGHQLVQLVFEGSVPMVAFNRLTNDSERNEQRGLANIMKGVFSAFRNPAAHEPRLKWHVREEDALDLLTTLSLVHRRLDDAVTLRRASASP